MSPPERAILRVGKLGLLVSRIPRMIGWRILVLSIRTWMDVIPVWFLPHEMECSWKSWLGWNSSPTKTCRWVNIEKMMSMDVLWLGLMLGFHGLPRKVNDMTSKMKEFKDDERRPPFHWWNGEMAVATHHEHCWYPLVNSHNYGKSPFFYR